MKKNSKIKKFTEKFNIEKYLNKKNIEFRFENDEIAFYKCPNCNGINKKNNFKEYKCCINVNKKLVHCFLCGWNSNLIGLLSKIENKSISQIFQQFLYNSDSIILPERLESKLDTIIPYFQPSTNSLIDVKLPRDFLLLMYPDDKNIPALEYCADRGFLNEKVFESLHIGYSENYRRLIFPVFWSGQLVGWQGRDITGEQAPKYYITKGMPKKKIIYNYENIKDAESIILVEGIIDLIKCLDHNPTCLFGKTISDEQINILLSNFSNLKEIIIAIDPEEDEDREILYEKLSPFFDIKVCILPEGTDPGDMSFEKMNDYLIESKPFIKKTLNSL